MKSNLQKIIALILIITVSITIIPASALNALAPDNNNLPEPLADETIPVDKTSADDETEIEEEEDFSHLIPNLAFRRIVYEFINKTLDELLDDEDLTVLGEIEELNVSKLGISNLTGIELFTGLTRLDCSQNKLTQLDVSKLENLIYLNCAENNLKELNMTNLTALTSLDCSQNKMDLLDVTGFENLAYLNCAQNHLSLLTVSSLTALTVLDCSHNQLIALDLTKLTKLENINCYHNKLVQITFAQPSENVKYLNCSNNLLERLNIGYLKNYATIDCSYNNLLSRSDIFLADTSSGSVDIYFDPQNIDPNLGDLLTEKLDPNFLQAVRELLGRSADSHIYENDVKDVRVLAVAGKSIKSLTGLEYFPSLIRLDCSDNLLTELDVSGTKNLIYLECTNNQLTKLHIGTLSKLVYIDCGYNQLTGLDLHGVNTLTNLLFHNNKLTTIDISQQPNLVYIKCFYNRPPRYL
jgi:Leucine-rich repeat (LRR) protein